MPTRRKAAPAQPDLTRIARGEPDSDSGKLVGPAVIGLVAVGLIGVVWWVFTLSVADKVQPTGVHSKLESNTAGAVQAKPVAADTDADDETPPRCRSRHRSQHHEARRMVLGRARRPESRHPQPARKGGIAVSHQAGRRGERAVRETVRCNERLDPVRRQKLRRVSITRATSAATATGGTAAAPIPVANVAAPPPAARAKDGELTLKFSSDSWAEVYDATGQRLFYDVGAAASAHTMRGPAPLRVILGNASGVAVEFNGRPALIPAGVQADGSTRFVINAHGRTVPASPASDGD